MAASTKKGTFSATISLLGPVAQSVEQRIENPCVGGSIPPQATSLAGRSSEKRATLFYRTNVARFCTHCGRKRVVSVPTPQTAKKVTLYVWYTSG